MGEISATKHRVVQRRETRLTGWTKARRRRFLELLATTCNVKKATRAIGMGYSSAYKLRHRDGEFARLWDAALETGYARLEVELLQLALGEQPDAENPTADEVIDAALPGDGAQDLARPAIEIDKALAVQMLAQHRRAGERQPRPPVVHAATTADTDAALARRLAALARCRTKARAGTPS